MKKTKKSSLKNSYFSDRIRGAMSRVLDYPLTVLEAPMGYGKTTAVREQLNEYSANMMWLRIYDNSLDYFWNYFCNIFSTFDKASSQKLNQLQFPNDTVSMMIALNIIHGIELPENSVMVIDDYHLIECEETNNFFEFLVKSEMLDLHFVFTVRYIHFQNIEELKLKGYLYHIEKESFEFLPEDIIGYYKKCGINLKDKESKELYDFTEGWISALYLLMLNFKSEGSFYHVTNIFNLIEKAVYIPFSKEIKEFLMTMCIFDSFTYEQAIYMWQGEKIDEILSEIIYKNAFVKYDVKNKIYFMHNIFTNFLKDKLENNEYKLSLYEKAAHYFFEKGDYRLANDYFYLCGDFDNIYISIEKEQAVGENYHIEREKSIKYFLECPDEIKMKHHFTLILIGIRLYSFNEIELFYKVCEEFMKNMQKDKSLNEEERNRLLGEFEILMSFTGYNDINKMMIHHKKAYDLLKKPSSLIHWNEIWTFGSPSILYMFYRESGMLEQSLKVMLEDIPYYSEVTNGNATGGEYVMKAEVYFYRGDFENAEIVIHQAMYKAELKNQLTNIVCAMFLKIRLAFIKGDFKQVLLILSQIKEEITVRGEYVLEPTREICMGYIYSLLNQTNKVPLWLAKGDFSSNRLLFPLQPFLNIVHGRTLLINGEYLKLIGRMEEFLEIASVFPNLLGHIHTYIYVAAANKQIFRKGEALEALKKALDIALLDKIYMPFVENGDYIIPLLQEIYKQGSYHEHIECIMELYKAYEITIERIKGDYFNESKLPLTAREMEIAQLAAEGLSNREIGEKLFITQNTVKTQLKSVFQKLDINSRVLLNQYFSKIDYIKSPTG
jgi:LuxR family maltose regulon positive regulatory protein